MAINIKGKAKAAPATETNLDSIGGMSGAASAPQTPQEGQQADPPSQPPTNEQAPSQSHSAAPGHQTGASFLMTGGQQKTQIDQVKAVQDLRSKLRSGAREFWLNPGEFAKLYFLDGKVLDDGVFDTPMISLHFMQIGGQWAKFVCNHHTEGQCVVCNSNSDGSQPQTYQLFTVINIMPYVIQGGPNKGKTLPARLQLFAATMKVREKLLKRAQNRNGMLAGSIYNFSRESKQSPRTGDDIEFIQEVPIPGVLHKYPMLDSVYDQTKREWKEAPTKVHDYAKVYPVLTNAEIAQLRPDIASMAGFTAYTPMATQSPTSGFGSDPTSEISDEIPF